MERKRKISIRKVLRVLTTLIVVSGCVVAVMSANQYHRKETIKGVRITLQNKQEAAFHNEASIKKLLIENTHLNWSQASAMQLDVHRLEQIAKANPWIADANVYVDNLNVLNISIKQRVPSVRIFEQDGNSYYLDSSLIPIPISAAYVPYVPVITQLPSLHNDSIGRAIKAQAYYVAKHIEADKFWNAQVSEIIWRPMNDFTLIPNIGNHVVRIGDTVSLDKKLNAVLRFYKQIMNRIGWEKYTLIDARFKGQIVASPALPWTPPVDKAMSTMNWVKSIVGNDTASSAFAGYVMDTPPTNIANDIQIIPSVPMEAMREKVVAVSPDEHDATDSINYMRQQQSRPLQTPSSKPATPLVKPSGSTTTVKATIKPKALDKPSALKAKTNVPATKQEPSTKKEPAAIKNNTNTTPKSENETPANPSPDKPKYILEH